MFHSCSKWMPQGRKLVRGKLVDSTAERAGQQQEEPGTDWPAQHQQAESCLEAAAACSLTDTKEPQGQMPA
jgi:hypothetical protein